VACLCIACLPLQANDVDKYWQFSKLNHELSKNITLRGMLRFKPSPTGAHLAQRSTCRSVWQQA
jgi:hypothetical protein